MLEVVLTALVAGATFAISLDGGGYSLTSRHAVAICLLWLIAVAVGLGVWPRAAVPVPALVSGGLLAAFAAWTALSILWAPSAEKSFVEVNRVVCFLALLAVVVLSATTRASLRAWLRGLAIGVSAVGLLGLSSRLFPELFEDTAAVGLAQLFPSTASRLNYPLQYWNGLATLLALGVPCLLWAATSERRTVARAAAVLPLPALAGALYMTSSRGGIGVAAVGALLFVILARSWTAVTALVVATAASVPAAMVLAVRDDLMAGPVEPDAAAEGRSAALWIGLLCAAAALLFAFVSRYSLELGRIDRRVRIAVVAAAVVGAAVALVLADPIDRLERFKAIPTLEENATIQAHLASGSGNGRWQLWESALDQFAAHKAVGEGAGTYEAWWAENGTIVVFVRDGHSLFLETLGELGLVGFVLLAGALLTGLAVGIRRCLRAEPEVRVALAALVSAYVAWLLEAGIDWIWESTVVTLAGIACLGLLVGPATAENGEARRRRPGRATRIATPVVTLALVVAAGIPLLAQSAIGRSQSAVRAGDAETALDAAQAAQRFQPWASSTHLQRALVEELRGDLQAARTAVERALELDERDWRLWLVDARIETKLENFDEAELSLRRAVELNPRSPRFSTLPGAETG